MSPNSVTAVVFDTAASVSNWELLWYAYAVENKLLHTLVHSSCVFCSADSPAFRIVGVRLA